jgi:hypothetical protein
MHSQGPRDVRVVIQIATRRILVVGSSNLFERAREESNC